MKNSKEQKLYELHAKMCGVFTSPKRLEILNALRKEELAVGEIAAKVKLRQANLSQHLGILRERGIVKTRREGVKIYYSLSNPKMGKAFDLMREILLEKLSESEKLSKELRAGGK